MIHVIGDIILDCYINGTVDRVSPEAPVPVINIKSQENKLGGAGNVASVLSDFNSPVKVWTSFANDENGKILQDLLFRKKIEVHNFALSEVSTCKTRILASGQQVARLDKEINSTALGVEELALIIHEIKPGDSLIVSDYSKGLLPPLADFLYKLKQKNIETYIDPKDADISKYKHCFLLKPNLKELKLATLSVPDIDIDAQANWVMQQAQADICLVTKSSEGMSLYSTDGRFDFEVIPRQVYDVTGAGDTVIAALAYARYKGLSLTDAAFFANYCAAYAVTKIGCARMNIAELSTIMSDNQICLDILSDVKG